MVSRAETPWPVRMAVVTGSFPYRAQYAENCKALGVDANGPLERRALPNFRGLTVERRVLGPNGKYVTGWTTFDHVAVAESIAQRCVGDSREPADLARLFLDADQKLVVALPTLMAGSYPTNRLHSLAGAVERFRALDRELASVWCVTCLRAMLQKRADAFPEAVLLRFVDTDIKSGWGYEYRVRVRMEELSPQEPPAPILGEWAETNSPVVAPPDCHVYVSADTSRWRAHALAVEIHQWVPSVLIGDRHHVVGDWVVGRADVVAGAPIRGRLFLHVPTWLHEEQRFRLTEKPVAIPFNQSIELLDHVGGFSRWRTATRTIEDESRGEALVMLPGGALKVLTELPPSTNPERADRVAAWDRRVAAARTASSTRNPFAD